MNKLIKYLPHFSIVLFLFSCTNAVDKPPKAPTKGNAIANPENWPKIESPIKRDPNIEKRIAGILEKMTIEQKVAQVIQPETREFTLEDMRQYGFGSYLNGGDTFPYNNRQSTSAEWVKFADELYEAAMDDSLDGISIPPIWGTDAVHGHNNIVGGTIFPHNIGLGATRNPELIKEIARVTALEVAVTGVDWVFAPTVAVARDDRWGRAYEAYSEAPDIVAEFAPLMVEGMQGTGDEFLDDAHVISTVKHFVGDGGTVKGIDRGDNIDDEATLRDIHAAGYITALKAGAQTVMASFNSWHGKRMHSNRSLLTDVLKMRMGFDGLIVGDWNAHGYIEGCSNQSCPLAFNAGLDIFMAATDWKKLYENTVEQVKTGIISMERLDDAVTRILRVKLRAGVFDKKPSERAFANKQGIIGSPEHRALARQAVRESLVLLKNKNNILPLSRKTKVLVAGVAAQEIGKVAGGWSITWQGTGTTNEDFPGATSILQAIKSVVEPAGGEVEYHPIGKFEQKPDVAIVVFGEPPYAEGHGDIAHIEFERNRKKSIKILNEIKDQNIPIISVFISGRPMWVNEEINTSQAFVAAWLPGSEGHGITDVIFKNAANEINHNFKGKLSFSWPKSDAQVKINVGDKDYEPLFPYGFGLKYGDRDTLPDRLSEERQIPLEEMFTTSEEGHRVLQPGYIFKGRNLQNTLFALGDPGNWQVPVTESFVSSVNGTVTAKSITWQAQDDSKQLTWNGTDGASAYITTHETMSLAPYLKKGGAISFDVRVDQAPRAEVGFRIDCGWPCNGSIFIEEELKNISDGKWHNLSIDLTCLARAGADLGKVNTPFLFQTSGKVQFTVANVKLEIGKAKSATISCSL